MQLLLCKQYYGCRLKRRHVFAGESALVAEIKVRLVGVGGEVYLKYMSRCTSRDFANKLKLNVLLLNIII